MDIAFDVIKTITTTTPRVSSVCRHGSMQCVPVQGENRVEEWHQVFWCPSLAWFDSCLQNDSHIHQHQRFHWVWTLQRCTSRLEQLAESGEYTSDWTVLNLDQNRPWVCEKKTVIICLLTNAWCRSHATNKPFLAKHLGAGLLKGEVFRLKEPAQSATTSASVSRSTRASSVSQLLMDRILLRFRQRSSCCTQMIVELEGEERLVRSVEESNGAEAWRRKNSRHALHTEKSWCQRLHTLGCWTSETTCI